MRLPVLQHQCLRPWSVSGQWKDVIASSKQREVSYRLRSCGKEAALPAAKHLPSFREEAPPRWYQAVGVLLGQPSPKPDNVPIRFRETGDFLDKVALV